MDNVNSQIRKMFFILKTLKKHLKHYLAPTKKSVSASLELINFSKTQSLKNYKKYDLAKFKIEGEGKLEILPEHI